MGQNDTCFSCDGSDSTWRVMFKEPVEIQPNVNYVASATLKVGLIDGVYILTYWPSFELLGQRYATSTWMIFTLQAC